MKEIEEGRQAAEQCKHERDQLFARFQVAQQELERVGMEIATADIDSPEFAQLVARRGVVSAQTEVLAPRVRRSFERLDEAQRKLAKLEQRAAAPPPAPRKRELISWEL